MKTTFLITAAAALSLAAAPAAGAQPGEHGNGPGQRAAGQPKRCEHTKNVGFAAAGSLASFDDASLTLTVAKANHHARVFLASNPAVFSTADVTPAFVGVTDANADGVVGLADVVATDRVRVIGKLALPKRGCDGTASVTVRKLSVVRPTTDPEPGTEPPAPTT